MPPILTRKRSVEETVLAHTRRALRLMLHMPAARAPGLAKIEELVVPGASGPLRARYYEARDIPEDAPLYVYFHGGGFVTCDIDTHDSVCSWLAKAAGARLLSISYRLAPEARFPAQLDDARAACVWAQKNARGFGANGHLVLCGDSAGAWLAAMCTLELNKAQPGAVPLQILLYPLVHVDHGLWAEEELRNFRFVGRVAVLYIARSLGTDSFPSLLDGDLSAAPTTIIAGGGALDPVRADVKTFGGALRERGVRVVEKKYPVLLHGGLNLTAFSKTAVTVLSDVGALARAELGH